MIKLILYCFIFLNIVENYIYLKYIVPYTLIFVEIIKGENRMKSTLNYEYDYEYDLVDIVIDKSHKYEKSIEITKVVF